CFEARKVRVVGQWRAGKVGVFEVNGVELSVVGVVGIELETDQPVGESAFDGQLLKNSTASAVQVEIGNQLLRALVDDVESAVRIIDKEPVSLYAGLTAHDVDSGEETRVHVLVILAGAGHRHAQVILDFKGQLSESRDRSKRERQKDQCEANYGRCPGLP